MDALLFSELMDDSRNHHANHHTLHSKNFGIFNPLMDMYFGTDKRSKLDNFNVVENFLVRKRETEDEDEEEEEEEKRKKKKMVVFDFFPLREEVSEKTQENNNKNNKNNKKNKSSVLWVDTYQTIFSTVPITVRAWAERIKRKTC